MAIWDSIMPEARFTPSYIKELENQIRKLGEAAYFEHEVVEPDTPEAGATRPPALTKEVMESKEVVSAAIKAGAAGIKEVPKRDDTTDSSPWGKRWDSHARKLDELLKPPPEVCQPSQIEQVMAAVQ